MFVQKAAATFGWLCVETSCFLNRTPTDSAATFGWLCVETIVPLNCFAPMRAATFGWLCVETISFPAWRQQ